MGLGLGVLLLVLLVQPLLLALQLQRELGEEALQLRLRQTVVQDGGLEVAVVVQLEEDSVELGHSVRVLPEGRVALVQQVLDALLGGDVEEVAGGEVGQQARHQHDGCSVLQRVLPEELDAVDCLRAVRSTSSMR